jgi:hypothetical protein
VLHGGCVGWRAAMVGSSHGSAVRHGRDVTWESAPRTEWRRRPKVSGERRVCVELRKVTAGTRRDTGLLIASASPARSGPAGLARDPRWRQSPC